MLHNASVPELWRRFTVYLPRMLAAALDMTNGQGKAAFVVSYCRVAEFQRRGLVHLHAVVRADPRAGQGLPAHLDAGILAVACRMAAHAVRVSHARGVAVFGEQLDAQVLDTAPEKVRKVAAYIAKYASKSAHDSGALDRRIRHRAELDARGLPRHVRAMTGTAWGLGADPASGHPRLRRHAHCLGFGGLFLTKSRGYSTTFAALRGARAAWRRAELEKRLGIAAISYESRWRAVGVGWRSAAEETFARDAAAALADERRLAWEESRTLELTTTC